MKRITSNLACLAIVLALAMLAASCGSSGDSGAASDDATEVLAEAESAELAAEVEPVEEEESELEEAELEEAEPAAEVEAEEPVEEPAAEEAAGDILRVALQFAPDSGLAIESDDSSVMVKAALIEGLVRADASGKPVPALAESWQRIDDTTWEFALRSGVTFPRWRNVRCQCSRDRDRVHHGRGLTTPQPRRT